MIIEGYYNQIEKLSWEIENKVNHEDIILALISELGEMAQAIRVENKSFMVRNKSIDESSRIEIIDCIMILTELYIRRGGTYDEMYIATSKKMAKWKKLTNGH